jgi:hypothetical protein
MYHFSSGIGVCNSFGWPRNCFCRLLGTASALAQGYMATYCGQDINSLEGRNHGHQAGVS